MTENIKELIRLIEEKTSMRPSKEDVEKIEKLVEMWIRKELEKQGVQHEPQNK